MIDLININKNYKRNKKQIKALNNVNLHFEDKGFVCITGPSGSGKTTLLNLIYGNVIQTSGEIYHNNIPYKKANIKKEISYIFQEYNLIDELNVYDNINLALKINGIEKTKEEIESKLKELGLVDVLKAYPCELSGGQQQRVAIARASLMNSSIILADEPTGALDDETAKEVIELLKEESKTKLVIVVSHNKELVNQYADQLIEINDGKIVLNESINEISNNIKIEETKTRKKGFKYLVYLGLKFIRFNSFKLYISLIMLIFSFSILILSISFFYFNPEKSYNSINDKRYNYTIIKKTEKTSENSFRYLDIEEKDLEQMNFEKSFIYNTSITISTDNNKKSISNMIVFNENIMNGLNIKIIGDKPKQKQALITKSLLDSIGETDYKKIKLSRDLTISGYIEIDYEKDNYESVDLNNAIYIFDVLTYNNPSMILTNKLEYSTIIQIESMSHEKTIYSCSSICVDSVNRAKLFADDVNHIGIPATSILILLSIVLLINYVYGVIDYYLKEVKIIKILGATYKDLTVLFGVQPFILSLISLISGYVAFIIVKTQLNMFFISEFQIYIPILTLSMVKSIVILLIVFLTSLLSIIIPLKKIHYVK